MAMHSPPLIPMTACVDVIDGGKDFTYRYWGTGQTELFGRDETGTRLSNYPVASSQFILSKQLHAVLDDPCPKFFLTTIAKDTGRYTNKFNLRMSVIDVSGEVSKILSACEVQRIEMAAYEGLEAYWKQDA